MNPTRFSPRKLFSVLLDDFPDGEAENLVDFLAERLRERFGLDEYESYLLTERYERILRKYIAEYLDDCRARKITPKFVFSEYDECRLVGRSFIYKTDDEETKRHKKRLCLIDEIRSCVECLSWDDFELLCRKLISLEPRYRNVRRRHRNGGIDFQGRYEVSPAMKVSFAGQAKRFGRNRKIGPNLVRELAGSMRNSRWAFGIIATTAGFSSGAQKLARQTRIECIDGEQIAFKIADRGFGIIENEDVTFDELPFNRWLHSR